MCILAKLYLAKSTLACCRAGYKGSIQLSAPKSLCFLKETIFGANSSTSETACNIFSGKKVSFHLKKAQL